MQDRYEGYAEGLEAPATHGFSIVPSDGTDLSETVRGVYVGTGGTLCVVLQSGAEVVLQNVTGGTILPLRVSRVKATGTTAADMVGLV